MVSDETKPRPDALDMEELLEEMELAEAVEAAVAEAAAIEAAAPEAAEAAEAAAEAGEAGEEGIAETLGEEDRRAFLLNAFSRNPSAKGFKREGKGKCKEHRGPRQLGKRSSKRVRRVANLK